MKLFISYARVDKRYCLQIVDVLEIHKVWFDHRLHAGQNWWEEIQKQILQADGFVYLLSPESVASEYCQKELMLAYNAGKHIFPVMIQPRVQLPEKLQHLQYADLTTGLTPEGVKQLLNAIYIAERTPTHKPVTSSVNHTAKLDTKTVDVIALKPAQLIEEIGTCLDEGNYDRAVFLLKKAKTEGVNPRFINIEALLCEAEAALESQSYKREAQREYNVIISMLRHPEMRKLGYKAFIQFQQQFPDYDPENIAALFSTFLTPKLDWVSIPAGSVTFTKNNTSYTHFLQSFKISKYPITNAQFQAFITAKNGYNNAKWWKFSTDAQIWHHQNNRPMQPKFSWGNHPRTNISWYEAMAFCNWFSDQTQTVITLPGEEQWQYAAQGNQGYLFPWGNTFNYANCNSRHSGLRTTTPVNWYEKVGKSPFGVCDMVGNVWQWCDSAQAEMTEQHTPRAVRGGSFNSSVCHLKTTSQSYLNPSCRYPTLGFRPIVLE